MSPTVDEIRYAVDRAIAEAGPAASIASVTETARRILAWEYLDVDDTAITKEASTQTDPPPTPQHLHRFQFRQTA